MKKQPLISLIVISLFLFQPLSAQESSQSKAERHTILQDNLSLQQKIWTSPFKMNWKKAAIWTGFALTTAILIKNDEEIFTSFQKVRTKHKWLKDLSPIITESGGLLAYGIGGGFCVTGWLSKNPYTVQTGYLALQAMLHSGLVNQLFKIMTGRRRPYVADGLDWWSGPFFMRNLPPDKETSGMNSFPSGHSTTVWSLATVISGRYPKFWVGALSYTVATLGALSRVVEEKHWLSDTFIGAALGFAIGRLVLHNHNRNLQFSPMINKEGVSLSARLYF